MKRVLFLFIILSPLYLFSEELLVIKSVYTPKDFYVGDLVTLLIYIDTPFNGELALPTEIPTENWIDIKSVNIISSGPDVSIIRVSFTSFAPGLRIFPDLSFGEHILHDYKIQTLSILDDKFSSLQPLAPQMVPPGTNLFVVFILIGVVFGPFTLFILFRTMFHSVKLAIKKYKRERPFRNYCRILKQLKNNIKDNSVRSFYVVITEQLRVYMSIRFNKEFNSATTMEMGQLLSVLMDEDSTEELLSICRFADLVKFSHTTASFMHREKDLKTIIEIVHQLEGKERSIARI